MCNGCLCLLVLVILLVLWNLHDKVETFGWPNKYVMGGNLRGELQVPIGAQTVGKWW